MSTIVVSGLSNCPVCGKKVDSVDLTLKNGTHYELEVSCCFASRSISNVDPANPDIDMNIFKSEAIRDWNNACNFYINDMVEESKKSSTENEEYMRDILDRDLSDNPPLSENEFQNFKIRYLITLTKDEEDTLLVGDGMFDLIFENGTKIEDIEFRVFEQFNNGGVVVVLTDSDLLETKMIQMMNWMDYFDAESLIDDTVIEFIEGSINNMIDKNDDDFYLNTEISEEIEVSEDSILH